MKPAPRMTLAAHFRELKSRIIYSALFFLATLIMGFFAAPYMHSIMTAPLLSSVDHAELIYTGLSDGLAIQFRLAGLFAVLTSMPFVLFQVFKYVAPALKRTEKRLIIPLMILSPVLFVMGASFAYFLLLPLMFEFMAGLANPEIRLLPDMKNYLKFSIDILRAFGIAFQLPLFLVLLNRTGVVSRQWLMKSSRYMIVGIFVLAAVLTPPDLLSLVLLALPLLVLFFASFLFMKKS